MTETPNEELISRAKALGLNVSHYLLMEPKLRNRALEKDIERAEKVNGSNLQSKSAGQS